MANVNFAQLAKDAGDIKPVPVGKYDAVIVKAEFKTASSGRDMWSVQLRIQSGPSAGRTLYNNFVLVPDNPNALRAFFINMQNLGITQDQIVSLGTDPDRLTPMLLGRQCLVSITHQEWNGVPRENVDRIEKHPSGPISNGVAPAAAATPGTPAPVPTPSPVPSPTPGGAPIQAPPAPAPLPQPEPAQAAPAPAPAPVPVPQPVYEQQSPQQTPVVAPPAIPF